LIGASQASLLYHLLCKASQLKFNKILALLLINKVKISNFGKFSSSNISPPHNLSIIDFFVILWIVGVWCNSLLKLVAFTIIGEFSGINFLKSIVLTRPYKSSKSSIPSSSAKSKKTLLPTLDHKLTFAATSIVHSKVINLSTTSIIFHSCF